MAKKLAVCLNLKGGVGKTTTAVNLACALLKPRRRVVVLDADEQATAAEWASHERLPVPVKPMILADDTDRAAVKRWIDNVLAVDADVAVLDLPPHLSATAGAAIGIADLVIIPCGASVADVSATAKTLALVERARAERQGKPPALLVPSRVDRRSSAGKGIDAVLADFGEHVGPAMAVRQPFADALGVGEWIGDYAPGSAAHAEVMALAETVERMLKHAAKK